MLHEIAAVLVEVCGSVGLPFIFKASYRKANRSSEDSFQGIGDIAALEALASVRERFNCPVITDVHETQEVELANRYVDAFQIPAFLFRQTELLHAAARTGKPVNIKKGQFAAPDDMPKAVAKIKACGNDNAWVCERGSSFGYHDLVVDMRSLVHMRATNCPVVYDATHSVQRPALGATSGGSPEYIPALTRAAIAVGIDGLFFETHPDPPSAKSDAATQLALVKAADFIREMHELDQFVRRHSL